MMDWLSRHVWLSCIASAVFFCTLLAFMTPGVTLTHLVTGAKANRVQAPSHQMQIYIEPQLRPVVQANIRYLPFQNARFLLEPFSTCIASVKIYNRELKQGAELEMPQPICDRRLIDLKHYLIGGDNFLYIQLLSKEQFNSQYAGTTGRYKTAYHEVFLTSAYFSGHWLTTLSCLGLLVALLMALQRLCRRLAFDHKTILILSVGIIYYIYWLSYRPDTYYTNDVWGHVAYIDHMVGLWRNPFAYRGQEYWHPPVYYAIMGRITDFFQPGSFHPLMVLRIFTSVFYLVFVIYALRTLQISVATRGWPYYLGVAMIVFWPAGPVRAMSITNDSALYAAWGAAFFYLVRWYQSGTNRLPYGALIAMGFAMMAKSGAVIPIGIVGACILYALLSRRITMRVFFARRAYWVYGIVLLCLLVNVSRPIYDLITDTHMTWHFGATGRHSYKLGHYFAFDLTSYLTKPFVLYYYESGFASYFIKTLLYGEYTFFNPDLASVLNFIMLLFTCVFLALFGMIVLYDRQLRRELAPHLIGVTLSVLGIVAFMVVKQLVVTQDFRFCLPMLAPMVVVYVRGIIRLQRYGQGAQLIVASVPVLLMLLGVAFYLSQPFYNPTY